MVQDRDIVAIED